jgi:hypothetical protein
VDSGWGQGFYSAFPANPSYGGAEVRVAVRITRAFMMRDSVEDAERYDALLRRTGFLDDPARALASEGYDGLLVHYQGGQTVVVVYRGDQVKVVVDEAAGE